MMREPARQAADPRRRRRRAARPRPDDHDRPRARVQPVPAGPRPAGPGTARPVTAVSSDARFAAPKGVPEYYPPDSAGVRARARHAPGRRRPRRVRPHRAAGLRGHRAVRARGRRVHRRRVSKEMYTFADRGGRSVTLRPEGTAGVMRAVIEHGLDRGPLPVKLRYAGPFFRYERPQAGPLPAAAAGRDRGDRRRRPGAGRRGDRGRRRGLPGVGPAPGTGWS